MGFGGGAAAAAAVGAAWQAWQAPILAAVAALLLPLAGRALRQDWPARAAGGAALLLGWAALAWQPGAPPLQVLLAPRGWVERLVAIGLAALLAGLAQPLLPPRLARLVRAALYVFLGAWLAGPLGGRPEYWRVLLAAVFGAWLLARLVADDPARLAAAAAALWGALAVIGSPWAVAALVPAAASAAAWGASWKAAPTRSSRGGSGAAKGKGKAAGGTGGAVASIPLFPLVAGIVAASAAASLGGGRLSRGGGFGSTDAAALSPLLAAMVLPVLSGRMGRLGTRLGAPGAALASAGLAVSAAWIAARVLR